MKIVKKTDEKASSLSLPVIYCTANETITELHRSSCPIWDTSWCTAAVALICFSILVEIFLSPVSPTQRISSISWRHPRCHDPNFWTHPSRWDIWYRPIPCCLKILRGWWDSECKGISIKNQARTTISRSFAKESKNKITVYYCELYCIFFLLFFSQSTYLYCHLAEKYKFVALEQTPARVYKHEIRDTVDEQTDAFRNIVRGLGEFYSILKDCTERFQRELIEHVDLVQIV